MNNLFKRVASALWRSAPAPTESSSAPGAEEAKSVTLAQTMPRYVVGRPFPGLRDWTAERAIREGLKANPWVSACIDAYVKSMSIVPHKIQVWMRGEWHDQPEHPAQARFSRPNSKDSRSDLVGANIQDIFLSGNLLTTIIDSDTSREPRTLALWPITPDKFQVVAGSVELIDRYLITRTSLGGPAVFPAYSTTTSPYTWNVMPRDVVHCMFRDPANPFWGLSPLVAASMVVNTDVAAILWNFSALENRVSTSGYFRTEQAMGKDQHAEFKEILVEEVSGAENAYVPMLLMGGLDWKETTKTALQMDWVEGRKLNREEICAVFRVPPPIVGISENATLANLEEYHKSFYEDSVIPLAGIIADAYTRAWIQPRWGPDVRLIFDFSLVPALLPQLTQKIDLGLKLQMMGVPLNIINRYLGLGLPYIDGGDVSWSPSNMMPLADAAGALSDPSLQGSKGAKMLNRVLSQMQALEKRLRRLERGEP